MGLQHHETQMQHVREATAGSSSSSSPRRIDREEHTVLPDLAPSTVGAHRRAACVVGTEALATGACQPRRVLVDSPNTRCTDQRGTRGAGTWEMGTSDERLRLDRVKGRLEGEEDVGDDEERDDAGEELVGLCEELLPMEKSMASGEDLVLLPSPVEDEWAHEWVGRRLLVLL